MATSAGFGRTPYALMWLMSTKDAPDQRGVTQRFKTLDAATDACRKLTLAWARLIGGQRSPLAWYVRDERSGIEHHLTQRTRGSINHGTEQHTEGTLF